VDTLDKCEEKEWDALYVELGALLEKHGTQSPYDDGDFRIVDDNYGTPQHKVCVTRLSFLTRPLAVEIQRVLRKYSLAWEVLLSLDKAELRPTENDLGVLVRKSDIQEHWSAERMQKAFGKEFLWGLSLAAN
jgi:hypothetical protein